MAWQRDARFKKFAELFDARKFFDAHEELEGLWLEIKGEEREFLQGLIQIAVALEHAARGNPSGAAKVLNSAGRRLERFGERHAGIEIGRVRRKAASYLEGAEKDPPRLLIERTE